MKREKGLKQKFLEVLNSKPAYAFFIFIILSLAMVIAGDVIVKEGTLDVDSNVLYVDSVNNKVGIGTKNPIAPLHVYGNITGTGYVTTIEADANQPALQIVSSDGGASTYVLMTVNADNANDKLFGSSVTGDTYARFLMTLSGFEMGPGSSARDTNLYRAATNSLKTDDQLTASNLITSSLSVKSNLSGFLYVNSTNVGIGTATPIMSLNVVGEVNITGISNDGIGKVVCIKSDGNLGTCSSVVSADGTCTCG